MNFDELDCAEDFMNYFGLNYDERIVQVMRLHIMQRFHNYLLKECLSLSENMSSEEHVMCRDLLQQAYSDFVDSSAQQQKVFKVFQSDQKNHLVSIDDAAGV
ncbi:nitrogenase-stabilizing/protective protein NifW [Agaribacterium haliotis]|uniref:nitrogenase-stabilizing/protective protein NifW n=1 Tax=Agaribacterium haliotis TaxID=2013869 RepID=UPI000BB56BF7|nr:nitrogenase-stabilizing/protective protein NifW [Agaribacterium haliotis]